MRCSKKLFCSSIFLVILFCNRFDYRFDCASNTLDTVDSLSMKDLICLMVCIAIGIHKNGYFLSNNV